MSDNQNFSPSISKVSRSPTYIWQGHQWALSSGEIFVTASEARHKDLLALGASKYFDYSSPTAVSDILSAIKATSEGGFCYALGAVGTETNPTSTDLMEQCLTNPDTQTACVVFRPGPRHMMPVASKKAEFRVQLPGMPNSVSLPAKPEEH